MEAPTCPCGSGEYREAISDARGIFVAYVCDQCRDEKLADYRPEIFSDPRYLADVPVDDAYDNDISDHPFSGAISVGDY